MENYQIILKVVITHSYFPDGVCRSLDLYPTPESKQLFLRRQMVCKKIKPNEWVFLQAASSDGSFRDTDEQLSLCLESTDPSFSLYTRLEEAFETGRVIKQLDVTLPAVQKAPVEINHVFEAKKMFWVYALLPRVETGRKRNIKLIELSDKVAFDKKEYVVLYERTATTFRSKKQIPLSNSYPFQLRLYEEKEHGDKLLSQYIPFPQPEDTNKNNEIITYIYY
ncbi:hypothetical protein M2480_002253 [Parabacteroides sp. PFB2-12]|uniref:hypothetical protein n=1 Tax=unclassified Parabacteroides TaxID=2649774 RepID=UPI002473907A|nr:MULTISPECIES: hypothetical protein [unclassified Parabacteroides]MDH6343900.1 hypothetical protein [Parabacteroides sp. PM6-13]MDH6391262.1 hypothetical protein [Parabacteroides sp. PFB2-12]